MSISCSNSSKSNSFFENDACITKIPQKKRIWIYFEFLSFTWFIIYAYPLFSLKFRMVCSNTNYLFYTFLRFYFIYQIKSPKFISVLLTLFYQKIMYLRIQLFHQVLQALWLFELLFELADSQSSPIRFFCFFTIFTIFWCSL